MIKIKAAPKNAAVMRQLNGLPQNFFKGARLAFWQVGKKLVEAANNGILREIKTGTRYKYKGRMIRASSAGQYPANRSGTLRKSIDFTVIGTRRMVFGARASYAGFVHKGTSRTGPRPFLKKADATVFPLVDRQVDTAFTKKVNYRV